METVRGVEERKCEAYYSYGEHLRDDDNEEMRHLRRSYLRRDCPRRSTDRTQACGACNVGSIPAEGTNKRSDFCSILELVRTHFAACGGEAFPRLPAEASAQAGSRTDDNFKFFFDGIQL